LEVLLPVQTGRRNVYTAIGYLRQAALQRDQWDITELLGNKQRSCKIMKIQMFTTSEEVKPDAENRRGLSLAAVKCTTVHLTRQPL
jgi:hypothetical protein